MKYTLGRAAARRRAAACHDDAQQQPERRTENADDAALIQERAQDGAVGRALALMTAISFFLSSTTMIKSRSR